MLPQVPSCDDVGNVLVLILPVAVPCLFRFLIPTLKHGITIGTTFVEEIVVVVALVVVVYSDVVVATAGVSLNGEDVGDFKSPLDD